MWTIKKFGWTLQWFKCSFPKLSPLVGISFHSRKMKMLKMICARLSLMIRQKYLVLMKKIKLMKITQKQYLLNFIQSFLVTVRLIVKLDFWTLNKDKYLILYIIGLSHTSKSSLGRLQNDENHFICFSREVGAVLNRISWKLCFMQWIRYFCIEVVT